MRIKLVFLDDDYFYLDRPVFDTRLPKNHVHDVMAVSCMLTTLQLLLSSAETSIVSTARRMDCSYILA